MTLIGRLEVFKMYLQDFRIEMSVFQLPYNTTKQNLIHTGSSCLCSLSRIKNKLVS